MTEAEIEKENAAIAKEYRKLLRISYQSLSAEDKKINSISF
jgi:GTP pyrophosphokinase